MNSSLFREAYVNTTLVAEDTKSSPLLTDSSFGDLTIGALLDDYGNGTFFTGSIDDLAIYDRGLTENEILNLFGTGIIQ